MSNSLWLHEPQHARPPCLSPTPRVYPNSCPLSWWCHPTISFSLIPFSSCLQSFPASGSFPMNQFFSSIQFSSSVVPDSLWPHGLQDTRLPCPSQILELTQTHGHRVGNAIQPAHPLSSPSPPTFSLFQHQGLFKWVSSSHQVDKVLEFQLQYQSFQWIFRTDFL